MVDENVSAPASAGKRSTKKKLLIWGGASVLLLAVLAVLFVCALFTSPRERKFEPSMVDFFNQTAVLSKLHKHYKNSPDKPCVIQLGENEVNSLLRVSAFWQERLGKKEKVKLKDLAPVYKNGLFYCVYPYDTGMRFLNGGVIELYITFALSKQPGKVLVDIKSCKAGAFTIPASKINDRLDKCLAALHNDKKFKLLDKTVPVVSVEADGSLKIVCAPENALRIIQNK